MADVKFYGMTLDFQYVKDCYNNRDFSEFVFQPYMEDAEKWKDNFFLLVYALGPRGNVLDKRDLVIVENDTYEVFNRVELGNIRFTRAEIKPFIDEDTASGNKFTKLYFSPYQYGEYAAYKVTGIQDTFKAASNVERDLKPSPPAMP